MSSGRLLARNSALNLLGQVLPLVVALVTIPVLVRGFGAERFGVLTLAWAAIGYFSLFELGLGRALTQAVAQRLGAGTHDDLPAVTWTALLLLFGLGTVGALALAAATPVLVTRVLNVPPELRNETIQAFWILALSIPLVVTSAGLRGIVEAHQHFGIATILRLPLVLFMFVGPVVALAFSRSLVPAVWILVAGRAVGFLLHLFYCINAYPFLRNGMVLRGAPLGPLMRFGGWSTVTNIVSPMMVTMDRFFVGALLPLAAVAHYVTPYEAVTKALIIPTSLAGVMFPAFAATVASQPDRMAQLYQRSLRVAVLAMFPVVLVAVALAREGLLFWVGPLLPPESALVLQWLAVGVLVNGIAQTPFAALQSAARPDLIAKLHVVELPFYAVATLLLVRAVGLPGVAIAWTLRVTVDAVALLFISRRTLGLSMSFGSRGDLLMLAMLASLGGAVVWSGTQARVLYVATVLVAFLPLGWYTLLDNEREGLRQWAKRPTSTPNPQGST